MKNLHLLVFSSLLMTMACEEQYSYETYDDPFAIFNFVNADSIYQIGLINQNNQDSILALQSLEEQLDSSLLAISDSLGIIDMARDTGNLSFEELRSELIMLYSTDSTTLIATTTQINDLQEVISELNVLKNELAEGNIQLDYVTAQFGLQRTETYTDSIAAYNLPLNINDTLSRYLIGITGDEYSLSLGHKNEEFITADLGVKIAINQIEWLETSFDSVTVSCKNSNCSSNVTTIICYY
jgi:TolA-binding protein